MLRRANSKSSSGLNRRKSTSSVYRKQDHIDPEVARRQAQAAATYAFARAYERANAEIGLSGEPSINNEILGQRSVLGQNLEADQRGRGVRRQQSVRFTGPESISRHQSIGTRASQRSLEGKAVAGPRRPRALTNNFPVPAAYRPPSRSSSIGKASIGKGTAQNNVAALAAYDEYYTREDDIASTPSSYRRIRKSKSTRTLSSPSETTKNPFNDASGEYDYNTRIWNRVPWIPNKQQQAVLKAPKSMSFLRGGREHMPKVREDHDSAVQMARDKFLHQIEQQRLREQPSFLFRTKARRVDKPFRQSVRSGSTNSYGPAMGSANQIALPKEGSLRVKVRRASQTLRNKLKELFRRGTDQLDEAKIPEQQVEARTAHGSRSYVSIPEAKQDEFVDIPFPDSVTVSRVASRLPSLHSASSNQQLKSRNGSFRSQRSGGSENSVFNNWTSLVDNAVTSRQTQAEKEAQRLSIIQENGTHVSSASIARLSISNQLSAYPLLHRPNGAQRRGGPYPGPVDSQKVCSALMKRLDENSPMAKLEAQRIASNEIFGPAICIPPRSTSVNSRHSSRGTRTPTTIRHVQGNRAERDDDERPLFNDTVTSLPREDDDVFSPKPSMDRAASLRSQDTRSGLSARRTAAFRDSGALPNPITSASEGTMLPPQQQAARNEVLKKTPKPLRETRSTFFGNSSFAVSRTTSPYRRALAETGHHPSIVTSELHIEPTPKRILFTPPVIHCSDPTEVIPEGPVLQDKAYTESVYSRTTSGRVPAAESSQSLAISSDDFQLDNSGSMVLGNRQTYQPTGPTKGDKSLSGPAGRKELLHVEATMIGESKDPNNAASINYALPSMPKHFGHFREHAQITDEETEVSQRKGSLKKQPIGILQQDTSQPIQLKPILKHKSSLSLDGFPKPPPPPPPLPPPVPMRSPLRPMQSRASLRPVDATSTHGTLNASTQLIKPEPFNNHQLLRSNAMANVNCAETPARLIKRTGRPSNNYDPSPGIGAAVKEQFGSVGSRTPYSGTENSSPADAARSGRFGPVSAGYREMMDTEAQAMGSRVMVDMFLSSRRRMVAGSDESNAFL